MTESRANPSYTQINRNFCNFPIARDGRVRVTWRRSRKTGRTWCELPGDKRIRFRLAADADSSLRRLPTGLDVAVLLVLLRAGHVQQANVVEYTSVAAVIRDMGLEPEQRHRRATTDALALWSSLTMIHSGWYSEGRSGQKRILPPPICGMERSSGRLRIRLSPEWRELSASYYVRVPCNLPFRAPLQNLILWLLTAPDNDPSPEIRSRITQRKKRRWLCRKIGVNHGTRNQVLSSTIAAAGRWFERQGGSLDSVSAGEFVVFSIHDPKHRGVRKKSLPRARSNREDRPAPSEPKSAAVRPALASAPSSEARIPVLVEAFDDAGHRYTMFRLPNGKLVDQPPERPMSSAPNPLRRARALLMGATGKLSGAKQASYQGPNRQVIRTYNENADETPGRDQRTISSLARRDQLLRSRD